VVDLPPGTGDVALSLSQTVPVAGAIVVTTPQQVSLADSRRAIAMYKKLNIPTLGVVENMSYFVDSAGVRHELFGKGGGQAVADFAEAPLLAQVPIDQSIREWADKGTPVVQAAPDTPIARVFVALAERVVERVSAMHEGDSEDAGPIIDRSGGEGKKRLPVMR
jgi:ATP-binding protein involved in chromosome partitioning